MTPTSSSPSPQNNVIILPGSTATAQAAVEIKAAWKVLTPAETRSGRFHTVQALLDGAQQPVTVGLVGFHFFLSNGGQGSWATFAKWTMRRCSRPATSGTFNFFNPKCTVPGNHTAVSVQHQGCRSGAGRAGQPGR